MSTPSAAPYPSPAGSRPGRGRRYDLLPIAGFRDPTAGTLVAALDELSARVFDLISDLPPETLDYRPEGANNSIAMLILHMASGEASWAAKLTGEALPSDLAEQLQEGRQGEDGELPGMTRDAKTLIALCQRVRDAITKARLKNTPADALDRETPGAAVPLSPRSFLLHQIWHWTYHSGQIGLLRRLAGARYQWRFEPKD